MKTLISRVRSYFRRETKRIETMSQTKFPKLRQLLLHPRVLIFAAAMVSVSITASAQIMTPYGSMTLQDLRLRAVDNDNEAQRRLGLRYLSGAGVATNAVEAVRWFKQSAAAGNVAAQYQVGILYDRGLGVEKNLQSAVQYYRAAAEAGYPDAQFNMGWCYLEGDGVPKEVATGISWFERAAKTDPKVKGVLGQIYYLGKDVPRDHVKAASFLRQAAYANDSVAALQLGRIYQEDRGVPRSPYDAIRWFRTSAELGNPDGMFAYAQALLKGEGAEKNTFQGKNWMTKAAAQNHKGALAYLQPEPETEQPKPVATAAAPIAPAPPAPPSFMAKPETPGGFYNFSTGPKVATTNVASSAPGTGVSGGLASSASVSGAAATPAASSVETVPAASSSRSVTDILGIAGASASGTGASVGNSPSSTAIAPPASVGSALSSAPDNSKLFTAFGAGTSPIASTPSADVTNEEKERAGLAALRTLRKEADRDAGTPSSEKSEVASENKTAAASQSGRIESDETRTGSFSQSDPNRFDPYPDSRRSSGGSDGKKEMSQTFAIMTLAAAFLMIFILLLFFFTFKTRLTSLETEIRKAQFELANANLNLSSMMQQVEQIALQLPENASSEQDPMVNLPDWEKTQSNAENFKISRTR